MPGDETLQKRAEDSDSEEEDDDVEENIRTVEVDISQLHPLSPEVIAKQVRSCCCILLVFIVVLNEMHGITGYCQHWYALDLWVLVVGWKEEERIDSTIDYQERSDMSLTESRR